MPLNYQGINREMKGVPPEHTKYKPGQSGNPKGRPKLPDLKGAIAQILAEEKDGKTALEAILAALRAKAAKGDVRAAQELLDRGYGRATQQIEHSGNAFESISVTIKPFEDGGT